MFNIKRKLTCKVILHFNNDLQTFSSKHAVDEMLVWIHKLMLCDVDFLVANAFKIDIKSCKDNFIFEL